MISPVAGTAVPVAFGDALVLLAVAAAGRDAAADWAWNDSTHRDWLRGADGRPLHQRKAFDAGFTAQLNDLTVRRLAKYQEIGLIAPRVR
jgi:hypothetical protein